MTSRHHADYRHRDTLYRLLALAVRLGAGGEVTTEHIMERYGVSLATAKRDMTRLEATLPLISSPLPRIHRKGPIGHGLRLMRGASLVPLLVAAAA